MSYGDVLIISSKLGWISVKE